VHGLEPARLERLCRGECYNPSDERHPIMAIEVIRIRAMASEEGLPVSGLERLSVPATARTIPIAAPVFHAACSTDRT
jgi:hypothetical protein